MWYDFIDDVIECSHIHITIRTEQSADDTTTGFGECVDPEQRDATMAIKKRYPVYKWIKRWKLWSNFNCKRMSLYLLFYRFLEHFVPCTGERGRKAIRMCTTSVQERPLCLPWPPRERSTSGLDSTRRTSPTRPTCSWLGTARSFLWEEGKISEGFNFLGDRV